MSFIRDKIKCVQATKGSNAEHANRLNHWFRKSHDGVGVIRSIQTGKSDKKWQFSAVSSSFTLQEQ